MNDFRQLLRSEFTKFRTVRGWVVAIVMGAAVIVAFGVMPGLQGTCGEKGSHSECVLPVGPEGQEVTDSFAFLHQPLAGDGSITVRVASLTDPPSSSNELALRGVVPWSKAGLLLKDGTDPGSTYAAVMVTGGHGVRMQYDYVHDQAGPAGRSRWLRLTRRGDTVTGAESVDGRTWVTVDTVKLSDLPSTVEVGLFTTSPQWAEEGHAGLATSVTGSPSRATGTFDHLSVQGGAPAAGAAWKSENVGGPADAVQIDRSGGLDPEAETFTLTGSGDIAPAVPGATGLGVTISQTLVGAFVGLIVMAVLGALFITAEYRRGLIRTTLVATPRRGQVLAAKAVVLAGLTFGAGLIATATVVLLGRRVLRANGVYVHPATFSTELRLIFGTAALLAVAALLALGLGALLRRSVTAVTTAVLVIVLPYLLTMTVLSGSAGSWLLRVTPAAAFALQQAAPEYPQVANIYTPANGFYPLSPWAGFAVLLGWAGLALGLAAFNLRRTDA
jgi:hypothetical protein